VHDGNGGGHRGSFCGNSRAWRDRVAPLLEDHEACKLIANMDDDDSERSCLMQVRPQPGKQGLLGDWERLA